MAVFRDTDASTPSMQRYERVLRACLRNGASGDAGGGELHGAGAEARRDAERKEGTAREQHHRRRGRRREAPAQVLEHEPAAHHEGDGRPPRGDRHVRQDALRSRPTRPSR